MANKRINKYLNQQDIDQNAVSKVDPLNNSAAVVLKNASFKWESSDSKEEEDAVNDTIPSEKHVLKDISIHVKKNSLTAVVGAVGSGKSSLIAGSNT